MSNLHYKHTYGTLSDFLIANPYKPFTDGDQSTEYKARNQKSFCEKTYTTDSGTYTRFIIWIKGSYNEYLWDHWSYGCGYHGVEIKVNGRVSRFESVREEDIFEVTFVTWDKNYMTFIGYPDNLLGTDKIPISSDLDYAKLLADHRCEFFICGDSYVQTIREFFLSLFNADTSKYTDEEMSDPHNYFFLSNYSSRPYCLKNPDANQLHTAGLFKRTFVNQSIINKSI